MKTMQTRNNAMGVARTSGTASASGNYYGSQKNQKSVSGLSTSQGGGAQTATITPTGYSSNGTHKTGISTNFQTKTYMADPGYTHQQTQRRAPQI